jgi:RsiW-degrading membrane proteinase PrsW (M82 family)
MSDALTYIVLFVVAFAPSIAYIIWIRNLEKYEREPWGAIASTFIWGSVFGIILAVLFSIILIFLFRITFPDRLYDAVTQNPEIATLILVCVVAPLAEEAAKAIGIFTAGKELDEVEDGLVYGASVGLGFAATENMLYGFIALSTLGLEAYVATMVVRSISSALLHASATSATGYGIGLKKVAGRGLFVIVPFFFLAVLMHATFNLFASMQSLLGLALAIIFAIVAIEFMRRKIQQLDIESAPKEPQRDLM